MGCFNIFKVMKRIFLNFSLKISLTTKADWLADDASFVCWICQQITIFNRTLRSFSYELVLLGFMLNNIQLWKPGTLKSSFCLLNNYTNNVAGLKGIFWHCGYNCLHSQDGNVSALAYLKPQLCDTAGLSETMIALVENVSWILASPVPCWEWVLHWQCVNVRHSSEFS